jgi:hypothetical protein
MLCSLLVGALHPNDRQTANLGAARAVLNYFRMADNPPSTSFALLITALVVSQK